VSSSGIKRFGGTFKSVWAPI